MPRELHYHLQKADNTATSPTFLPRRTMENSSEKDFFITIARETLRSSPAGLVEFLLVLNILLSISAFLSNVLILFSLRQVLSIHPPTKLFFRCLAVTDFCVGLIVQPLCVCNLHCVSCERYQRRCFVSCLQYLWDNKYDFVCSVCLDLDCHQCRQTPCADVGNGIQTCCNIGSGSRCGYRFLVTWCLDFASVVVE